MTDPPDLEVGRCALRTFRLVDERYCDLDDNQVVSISGLILTGMFRNGGDWLDGACVARCERDYAHDAPGEDCDCGIYGALSLNSLTSKYPQASRLVAVIAAEGMTFIGDVGLRTEAARVVAYWCGPDARIERHHCQIQFRDAEQFADLAGMLETYGIPVGPEK